MECDSAGKVVCGQVQSARLVKFMKRWLKQSDGRIYLIVDGHPVHKSGEAKRFVNQHQPRLRLIRMGDCPELNPDELLNQDVKTDRLGKRRPTSRTERMVSVRSHCIDGRSNRRSSEACFARIRFDPLLFSCLASKRRVPFNRDGIFRHYPELDP